MPMMSPRKLQYVSGASYGVMISGLAILAMFSGMTCTAVAGDLLRGGGFNAPASGSNVPGSFTPPAAAKARANALDTLARTTKAIQSVITMQAAASKLALSAGNNLGISNPSNPSVKLPTVTDGITPAGLYPTGYSSGVTSDPSAWGWTGVKSVGQSQTGKETTVTVTQKAQDAVLTWQSFNVGANTTLDFNQRAGGADVNKWIAFNIVEGSSIAPSQILGFIHADGQVYVINQNGIIFGGASQVNVNTLVASALPLNMNLVSRGLLNNPDAQFLFSALPISKGPNGTPAFTPPTPPPDGEYGDVTVEAGATMVSPASAANVGGRIALIGASVTNAGAIYTPDGQTILAAGLQVGFVAHPGNDPSLRGLDVYVGAVSSSPSATPYAGTATNDGLIEVPAGDITITGKTVDQLGVLDSNTTVSLNGRIDLLADYNSVSDPTPSSVSNPATGSTGGIRDLSPFQFLPESAGTVEFGPNSVTQILPDVNSTDTVVPTQTLAQASVNIQGNVVHMASASTILAPSAAINLDTGSWVARTVSNESLVTFVHSAGQIYLDSGAEIDAAGSADVPASVTQNIVAAQLLGAQLANDPLQRNSPLRGQTIQIDIREQGNYDGTAWIGSPLADLFGYADLVQQTIGELTINGGKVTMTAGGSIVMQPGSSVNVSGGYINYSGGTVQTTQVLTADGQIYDISQAIPDINYQGIFTGQFTVNHPTYGITNTYTDPIMGGTHYENGYVYGGNAGQILITAPSVALDGAFVAKSVTGPRQLSLGPAPGTFSLSFQGQSASVNTGFLPVSPAIPPKVVIESGVELPPAGPFALDGSGNPVALPMDRQSEVVLSPNLTSQDGFGIVTIDNGAGNIVVPAGVSWNGPAVIYADSSGNPHPGSITFEATNIDIEGSITMPGGNLAFTAYDINPFTVQSLKASGAVSSPPAVPGEGNFVLGANASIDASGLIVDNRLGAPDPETLPQVTAGGTVTIDSFSANLESGSIINVSGGVLVSPTGKYQYGNGGAIAVESGADPEISSVLGGHLSLGATLEGYSGAVGGSLTVQAQLVQIGGDTSNPDVLLLSPELFDQGGFTSYTVSGIGKSGASGGTIPAVLIAPDTQISAVVTSALALQNPADPGKLEMVPELLPVGSRPAASLNFTALGAVDQFDNLSLIARGDFVLGAGAEVTTDPQGSVSISGNTVTILGSVIVPAGAISVSGKNNTALLLKHSATATINVDLAPGSLLSTEGTTVATPNAYGYQTGNVLGGGSITVFGNILAESGAVLDVSGAAGVFDLPETFSSLQTPPADSFAGTPYVPTQIDSNAGTITLHGDQELFTDATLLGNAGGPSAVGGTLTVESGHFYSATASSQTKLPTDINLEVSQGNSGIPSNFTATGKAAIGQVVEASSGMEITGGNFAVNYFEAGGFDNLNLPGNVQFKGSTSIDARGEVTVGTGGFIYGDGGKSSIDITASYAALGQAFQTPQPGTPETSVFTSSSSLPAYFPPTYGLTSLTVTADLIDIGNLCFQDIGNVKFIANGGDIRGDGTLDVAGSITMQAGQIYPPTETTFTIAAYDYSANGSNQDGSITIIGSGTRQIPLSAGGKLNLYAATIDQGGALRAPIGAINLGWDGEGTGPLDPLSGETVPVARNVTLERGSVTSVSAVDPTTGQGILIPYGIYLNGKQWIDPTGTNITAGGVPAKTITVSAKNVDDQHGAVIDVSGGGDLLSYYFVPGLGGSADILASTSSYAIIPGYQAEFAPYAPYFNANGTGNSLSLLPTVEATSSSNLGSDLGYTNSTLKVGSQVYLTGVNGVSTGFYTLLPARYALLPGAFLVTPQSSSTVPPAGPVLLPDGSYITTGYSENALDAPAAQPLLRAFEVQSQAVMNAKAQYETFDGNAFLKEGAIENHVSVPRLPMDAGQLVFEATQSMAITGQLAASAPAGGLQSLVDISSPVAIDITGAGGGGGGASGDLVLNASALSGFAEGSLLVGGVREAGADGTFVNVTTPDITVDSGALLAGSDIILAANTDITVDSGAQIESRGKVSNSDPALILNGNGVLIRVSGNVADTESRILSTTPTTAALKIDGGAKISGASVTLDSSDETNLAPTAGIQARSLSLSSGQITVELNDPGTVPATNGLVLTENLLKSFQSGATSLSLLSYKTLDFYGTGQIGATGAGGQPTLGSLSINAGEIRGFNNGGGAVTLAAQQVILGNSADAGSTGAVTAPGGAFNIDGGTFELGANLLNVDQFGSVNLNATGGILAASSGGLASGGAMNLIAPLITGLKGTVETISAAGALQIGLPAKSPKATVAGGLGASLTFIGASIADNGDIAVPSGSLKLEAQTGALVIGNQKGTTLSAAGTSKTFFDLTKYTSGGAITLIADKGNVTIASGGAVSVAAPSGGGNGGTLSVSAPEGTFTTAGALAGQAGAGGQGGSFSLDVSTVALDKAGVPDLGAIDSSLDQAGFTNALTFRIRSSDVTIGGVANARSFTLSTDSGSIDVVGTIDAAGNFGGTIDLYASGNITLESGGVLNASAQNYNDAGKGGAVSIETTGGTITINGAIDLGVKNAPGGPGAMQDVTGTLYLRAPQIDGNGNIAATPTSGVTVDIAPITGAVNGASSIVVEGYYAQTVNAATAAIDSFESTALANASSFMANAATISSQIAGSSGLAVQVRPGEEIDNTGGDLVLENDWDLATARYGPNANPANPGSGLPGTLTLRAAGNLIFDGALSDGFDVTQSPDGSLWQAPLLAAGSLSWSYNLVAGADLSSANYKAVAPAANLPSGGGSLELGLNDGLAIAGNANSNSTTSEVIQGFFQVIRTGVGAINISTGGNLDLLNQFATIYTAGTQVADPGMNGTFDLPVLNAGGGPSDPLGAVQEDTPYPAQYSYGGGNVSIYSQGNIQHETQNNAGILVPDSEKELPVNWLYRRGYVAPSGVFGTAEGGDIASTTWWVDFSNFFEGVGALGGGNVTMIAGGSINNVDAVVPTNARMPMGAPNASSLVELGGGDLVVRAGNNINAGVYYVEQGAGSLSAGGSITTNSTRSPSLGAIASPVSITDPYAWLPTTLFLGNGSFDVTANDNLLLGPVANVFLLPEGYSNTYWYKTYFSTYSESDSVDVSSLTGSVTMRESATLAGLGTAEPILEIWLQEINLLRTGRAGSLSDFQPWLRLDESSVAPFATNVSIMPPTLLVTAFSGDINTVGNLTMAPAPNGTLQLTAAGSVNGLNRSGANSAGEEAWISSQINLSDADPGRLPQLASPFAYQSLVGLANTSYDTNVEFLQFITNLFNESGSTEGQYAVLQTQQELNAPGILHSSDATPLDVYAESGDISGIMLFSPKQARILAGSDITDVALYIQNTSDSSLSIVSAGRDILPYDATAPLLIGAQSSGNVLGLNQTSLPGDIQISGPGTLEVLAGRNLTLGESTPNADPTLGLGITSVGNARNPYLPFGGASIIAAAGLGSLADGLSGSALDFKAFESGFLGSADGALYFSELSQTDPALDVSSIDQYKKLTKEQQAIVALDIFYLVLRDAGRDHNLPGNPGYGNYTAGMNTIAALLRSGRRAGGEMDLTSREITTESGGGIDLFVPGGQLTVGINTGGGNGADQGILTDAGGNISIYTYGSVNLGTSRIFTLRGGNEIIWSTTGNIDAGAASKTVQSAPPTRVLVDPQSGAVQTDLAGLATGGGIGVLASVAGVPSGSVDLIAPAGVINAGDAGIRATGNLNLAAVQILNASNIQAGGASSGVPTVTTAAPNLGALSAASATVGATQAAAQAQTNNQSQTQASENENPSIINVEVIGYGGGDSNESM